MSQDQVAKLMAIAGRTPPSDDTTQPVEAPATPDLPPLPETPGDAARASPRLEPSLATEGQPRRVARRRPAGPVRGKIAANDDVPSIGGLIYALEQKPSTRIFRYAAIASLLWAVVGIAFGVLSLAPQWQAGTPLAQLLLNPVAFYTITATIVPIAVFWLLALLNWHIATLALKSSTMTEVAIRLAEPDRAAEQSIASLGQAVRRQVSFMNDAVSRALGRAGELEALVHNQVADLERSYEENERRIRGLIQELTGERHALLNTSGSVTETLKTLGTEIPVLIERLSTQQVTLANIIKGAGDNLAALEGSLATSTGRFENVVGTRTQQLQTVLEDYTTAFSTALGTRTEQMRLAFDGYMQALDTSLGNRTENLQTVFEEYARALDTTLANRAQALDIQLVERTRSLDDAFQKRLELFDDQIQRSTSAIDDAVSEKASLLTNALEAHAVSFRETISAQAADFDETVMNNINSVRRTSENITRQTMKAIDGLSQQSNLLHGVAENLFTQINGVTGRFESQGEQIRRVATQLDDANLRIESTLQSSNAELSRTIDMLSGRADEFGRTLAGYSSNIEGSLSDIEVRARTIAEELRDGAQVRSRTLLDELDRVKSQTEAESERTLSELRGRFQNVSNELSREFDSLSSRLSSASDETRIRAAEAAEMLAREQARLREEAARMPSTSREAAETMRRALQDQLRALDQLSQLSGRVRGDITNPDLPPPPATTRMIPTLSAAMTQQGGSAPPAPRGRASVDPRSEGHNRGEGWSLGDLLARASHDDEGRNRASAPASPAQPFKLDIATISRSIDAATAAAIWGRLKAGQRNVMVRSIYTPEARAIFDQIAQRAKVDSDLAQTVLRYVGDYERIIKDADSRDPSGRLAQSHMTSDSGRVYLFLAHAIGRIG